MTPETLLYQLQFVHYTMTPRYCSIPVAIRILHHDTIDTVLYQLHFAYYTMTPETLFYTCCNLYIIPWLRRHCSIPVAIRILHHDSGDTVLYQLRLLHYTITQETLFYTSWDSYITPWLRCNVLDTVLYQLQLVHYTMTPETLMNTGDTYHINVVFWKFAYSLMSRVIACINNIVTAIVNTYSYHQSPLMDKWERILYV